MPHAFFFLSTGDPASRMASRYAKHLELEFIKSGWLVEDCYSPWCLSEETHVLHFSGHGEPQGWVVGGRVVRPAVRARIVLSLACYAAQRYGEELGRRGITFVGFDDEFLFLAPSRCKHEDCDPQKIVVAGLTFEPWREMVRLILMGYPVSIAVEVARKLYRDLAKRVVRGEIDVPDDVREHLAAVLLHNSKHLTYRGPDVRVGRMAGTYLVKMLPAIVPLFAHLGSRR